jgi:hypothetical protein
VEHLSVEARRRRLGRRHHLAPGWESAGPAALAGDLVGLHATDPATIFLSVAARDRQAGVDDVARALYDDRSILRMLAMRRTMFVAPVELVPVLQRSSADAVARRQRTLLLQLVTAGKLSTDPNRWVRRLEQATLAALRERGSATAAELRAVVPGLRKQVLVAEGKAYETTVSMANRVLTVLAAQGHIVRGRPGGTWISTQYRWVPTELWSEPLREAMAPDAMPSVADARAELVRRWLAAFGPGTVADIKWWTGWGLGEVRSVLAAVGAVEVDLDGATGLVLPGDETADTGPLDPWAALLPALDATIMGWSERDWYLGRHRAALFDRNGNAGPTIWADGRVVGGWAHRRDGTVALRLLEDVGREAVGAVEAEAGRLEAWLGDRRFTPRFRTPLERELTA